MRPRIFVSAVTRELKEARDLVVKFLDFLHCDAEWMDVFGTETGDVRTMLTEKIDSCDALIQLVGHAYGAEPPPGKRPGLRESYTAFEARYAHEQDKRVWYLVTRDSFPSQRYEAEDAARIALQTAYRVQVETCEHLYHNISSLPDLENKILRMLYLLDELRDPTDRWVRDGHSGAAVLTHTPLESAVAALHGDELKRALREALVELNLLPPAAAHADETEDKSATEERAYAEIAARLGLPAEQLRAELPAFAQKLSQKTTEPLLTRAQAAKAAEDWSAAKHLALQAASEAEGAFPPRPTDARDAWLIAGHAATEQREYEEAHDHYRNAERLTNRDGDPLGWAGIQHGKARIHYFRGNYRVAAELLRPVISIREQTLGPEHPDSLQSRHSLAMTLAGQHKDREAEAEYRAVLPARERVLGSEHPNTLHSRNNLANTLRAQGKDAEAEAEHRAVLALRERVLGPEHPDTLASRNNLAIALRAQGKHAEAEAEHRAVLALHERLLGPEHPNSFRSCFNLGLCLEDQDRKEEALEFMRRAEEGWRRVLGADHPDTQDAERVRKRIDAALSEGRKK